MFNLLRRLFTRPRPVDAHALERVLASPPTDDGLRAPLSVKLPVPVDAVRLAGHVLVMGVLVGGAALIFDGLSVDPWGSVLLAAAIAVTILALVVHGGLNFPRKLEVSENGITLHRVIGTALRRWWELSGVSAMPDLSRIVISLPSGASTSFELWGLPEERRVAIANAIRLRLKPDRELGELPKRWSRRLVAGSALQLMSAVLLVASIMVGTPVRGVLHTAQALGVRCSGPSEYLSARFDVPRQPGCIFIRVSGSAARAGIHQGDEMVAMDGTPVTSGPQFEALFNDHSGSRFTFTVVRSGSRTKEDVRVSFGRPGTIAAPDDDPLTAFLAAKADLGQHPDADIAAYTRAIYLAPGFDLAYVGRAQIYRSTGQTDEAIADYRKAIGIDPQLSEALRGLVELLTEPQMRAPDEANGLLMSAIASDGCDQLVHGNNVDCARDFADLSFIYLRNGEAEPAIDAATRAIGFDPTLAEPYADLAWGYYGAGDIQRAQESLAEYRTKPLVYPPNVHALETAIAGPPPAQ